MLKLNDGRSELYQWDTGRKLTVDGECSQVHFSNKMIGRSIDVDVVDGEAKIPDILLQTDKDLSAWAFIGSAESGYTKVAKVFKVNARNKPTAYVFTRSDQITLSEIDNRLKKVEEAQDPEAIKDAVYEYMEENPLSDQDVVKALGYSPAPFQAVDSKVQLPQDENGKKIYGEPGQFAISDGVGGVTWTDFSDLSNTGTGVSCYIAERETLDVDQGEVTASYIHGLYHALHEAHPDFVSETIYNEGTEFEMREYVFTTGEHNTAGKRGTLDADIKKPKYLILSGIHGNEREAAVSTYRFFRDLAEGKNLPSNFREGVVISVIPVGNPTGITICAEHDKQEDADKSMWISALRKNKNKVDINRNFAWRWDEQTITDVENSRYPGSEAESEVETQTIKNWLAENTDAEAFIDVHNSGNVWEVAMVTGIYNNTAVRSLKRMALRGLDRIIPLWREEIQYEDHGYGKPVYSYSSFVKDLYGVATYYAADVLKIPSIALEISSLQNEALPNVNGVSDRTKFKHFTAETMAAGAEALGNILLEVYANAIGYDKPELPNEANGDANYGQKGQFAVSDGTGGVEWRTVFMEDEVAY
jgi:hypothetical protein